MPLCSSRRRGRRRSVAGLEGRRLAHELSYRSHGREQQPIRVQAVFPTQVHYEVQLPVTIEVTRPWNVEVWFIDEPVGRRLTASRRDRPRRARDDLMPVGHLRRVAAGSERAAARRAQNRRESISPR